MTKNAGWQDGDLLSATDLARIEDQIVVSCTSATRPAHVEGQKIRETDTNRTYESDGTSWIKRTDDAWTSFSVSWTNLSLGNGTEKAYYRYVDGELVVAVQLTFGSTTSITGTVSLTVPNSETANANVSSVGAASYQEGGTGPRSGHAWCVAGGTTISLNSDAGVVNATQPFPWGSPDQIRFEIRIAL